MSNYKWFDNIWTVKHIRNGKVIWEDTGPNSLVQGGEEAILENYFRSEDITIWNAYQAAYTAAAGDPALLAAAYSIYSIAMAANNASHYIPDIGFTIRLCFDTLVVTDTLSTMLGEPSGNGYAAQTLERSSVGFPTKELNEGVYRLVSKTITFTASGGSIGPVNTAVLATSNTVSANDKLIAFRALAMTRTILDGDSLTVQFRLKLS